MGKNGCEYHHTRLHRTRARGSGARYRRTRDPPPWYHNIRSSVPQYPQAQYNNILKLSTTISGRRGTGTRASDAEYRYKNIPEPRVGGYIQRARRMLAGMA
eukprot:3386577-Rhodomonas_salina.1